MNNELKFDDVITFAQVCAELMRQGIRFHGQNLTIIITGY